MNLSDLLSKGLVEKFRSDHEQVKNEMELLKMILILQKRC